MDPITAGLVGLLQLVLFIVALVSIIRNDNHGAIAKLIWILIIFFIPILGPIAWFLIGRGRSRA